MSDYYSPKKHDCYDERKNDDCFECGTVTLTFNNDPNYAIDFSSAVGNVKCLAALAVGQNANSALHCLFKDGFKIVAFTADAPEDRITYTLTNC